MIAIEYLQRHLTTISTETDPELESTYERNALNLTLNAINVGINQALKALVAKKIGDEDFRAMHTTTLKALLLPNVRVTLQDPVSELSVNDVTPAYFFEETVKNHLRTFWESDQLFTLAQRDKACVSAASLLLTHDWIEEFFKWINYYRDQEPSVTTNSSAPQHPSAE